MYVFTRQKCTGTNWKIYIFKSFIYCPIDKKWINFSNKKEHI